MIERGGDGARFRAWFDVLLATFGTTVAAAVMAGCGDGAVSRDGLDLAACDDADADPHLEHVVTVPPVDFLQVLGGSGGSFAATYKQGAPCATASDLAACHDAIERAIDGPGSTGVVWSRGDVIGTSLSGLGLTTDVSLSNALFYTFLDGYNVVCGPQTAAITAEAVELVTRSGNDCGGGLHEQRLRVDGTGAITVLDDVLVSRTPGCSIGRRPSELPPARHDNDASLGAYFADAARLEAASVPAFERLARELAAHGAPASLISRARAARADEIRHTRTVGALARRYGHAPRRARLPRLQVRPLEALAHENAIEGCVRETFGALAARLGAARASDPVIARALRAIAADETEHAALAWDVAAWLDQLLDAEARLRVAEARRQAGAVLRDELAWAPDEEARRLAGILSSAEAQSLCDAMLASPFPSASA